MDLVSSAAGDIASVVSPGNVRRLKGGLVGARDFIKVYRISELPLKNKKPRSVLPFQPDSKKLHTQC